MPSTPQSVDQSLADSSVTATIDLASIDTNNDDRDAHVRSEDILDVATRPTMTFRSTKIPGDGADWTVAGEAPEDEPSATPPSHAHHLNPPGKTPSNCRNKRNEGGLGLWLGSMVS